MMGEAALFPSAVDIDLSGWLIDEGMTGSDLGAVLRDLAERLSADGVPLMRAFLAMPMINPDLRATSYTWQPGSGVAIERVGHDVPAHAFDTSPFRVLLDERVPFRRWPLRPEDPPSGFPILDDLRRDGATDHLTYLVAFDPTETRALRGAVMSFTTAAAGGFDATHVYRIGRYTRLLGLVACRFALSGLLEDVLNAYVGRDAGQRVLRGEMRRGEGHRRKAALIVADLRGFTSVADAGGKGLVKRLGDHLAAMAEPVEEAGGEVLKFMGDGLIAAFPADEDATPDSACAAALGAGIEALRRNEAANLRHPHETPLGLKIALHLGDVFYGNIGAASRLDFTVIGPAVNETCRIETLCKTLGRPLLMSEPFAEACGRPAIALGRHVLRGVAEPRAIFALAGL